MKIIDKIKDIFSLSYTDDKKRKHLIFALLNLVLCIVAFIMSFINIITAETLLFYITASYSLLCLLNIAFQRKLPHLVRLIFSIETVIMFISFIISGNPDGFSVLWTLLVPACALAVFGKKNGSLFSGVTFLIIIFFFWLPLGKSLLMYEYNPTFMLRFPFVYISTYIISLYIEHIRISTYRKLVDLDQKHRWLSRHDPLTEIYNRHAFYEEAANIFNNSEANVTSVMILDIDDFKRTNDTYGHGFGDKVLCEVANVILKNTCEHCISSRWGGEEFLVMMKCEHDPKAVAENIRAHFDSPIEVEGKKISITVSIGISSGSITDISKLSELINRADNAMYSAKNDGKNRITIINK